ncbi:MAG: S66 peptidase family protein [Calditrichia bacterium]
MPDLNIPPLLPGDKIGLVSPAGPVKPAQVKEGMRLLEELGYRCIPGQHAFANAGIVSAPREDRLSDLHGFLQDPDVRAIWALRGGYGSMQLLAGLDYELLQHAPRWLIGFSDLTAFQWALFNRIKQPSLSGLALTLQVHKENPYLQAGLRILSGEKRSVSAEELQQDTPRVITAGTAKGTLIGGTLTMIAALCGTSYFRQRRNLVLVLEDVNEPLYRIDRLFEQLDMLGFWKQVKAVVVGRFLYGEGELDVIPNLLARLEARTPVVAGFPYGHYSGSFPIPFGVRVELQTDPFFMRWRSPVTR